MSNCKSTSRIYERAKEHILEIHNLSSQMSDKLVDFKETLKEIEVQENLNAKNFPSKNYNFSEIYVKFQESIGIWRFFNRKKY